MICMTIITDLAGRAPFFFFFFFFALDEHCVLGSHVYLGVMVNLFRFVKWDFGTGLLN
jgi:hypothetical protein